MSFKTVTSVFGFYVIDQDEIGVSLLAGKYSGIITPGPGFMIPILQVIKTTKSSLQTVDLPDQQIVLSGNIAVTISGSLNFRVRDPGKAILEVADYNYSVRQLALTTISDILGTKTIEEIRTDKSAISSEIEAIIRETSDKWGISDVDIRLTDARLDESLLRAMMRETEAQKEANAIVIKAEADKQVAKIFAEAAKDLARSPGAMTLRVLQAMNDLSNQKSTVVVPIPIDLMTTLAAAVGSGRPVVTLGLKEARAAKENDKTVVLCPNCGAKYNVTDILGDQRYDARPDIPGQQVKCAKCQTDFTLLT